jgi:hypothetical protein
MMSDNKNIGGDLQDSLKLDLFDHIFIEDDVTNDASSCDITS